MSQMSIEMGVKSCKLSKQEKLANCGTKAADVLVKFVAGKLERESTEYFGALATTMTPQRLSIQSVAPYATV